MSNYWIALAILSWMGVGALMAFGHSPTISLPLAVLWTAVAIITKVTEE